MMACWPRSIATWSRTRASRLPPRIVAAMAPLPLHKRRAARVDAQAEGVYVFVIAASGGLRARASGTEGREPASRVALWPVVGGKLDADGAWDAEWYVYVGMSSNALIDRVHAHFTAWKSDQPVDVLLAAQCSEAESAWAPLRDPASVAVVLVSNDRSDESALIAAVTDAMPRRVLNISS